MPSGFLMIANSLCVTNWPPILRTFIASMAASRRAAKNENQNEAENAVQIDAAASIRDIQVSSSHQRHVAMRAGTPPCRVCRPFRFDVDDGGREVDLTRIMKSIEDAAPRNASARSVP